MKNKVTKILIAGAVVVIAISAVVIVKNRVSVNRDGTAVSIIGGADGPTSVFIAGKLSEGDDVMEYTSITMEEAKKYSGKFEFKKKNGAAYQAAQRNGWLNDYTWMVKKTKGNGK